MLYKHIAPIYTDLIQEIFKNIKSQRDKYPTTPYDQISNEDIVKSLNENKSFLDKIKFSIVQRDYSYLVCSIFTKALRKRKPLALAMVINFSYALDFFCF